MENKLQNDWQKECLIKILSETLAECEVDSSSEMVEKMAEKMREKGVFAFPGKVGDKIFFVGRVSDAVPDFVYDDTITKIGVTVRGIMHERGVDLADFGDTAFFSKEAANQAKERNK